MNIENENNQEEIDEEEVFQNEVQEAMDLVGVDENLNPTASDNDSDDTSDDDNGEIPDDLAVEDTDTEYTEEPDTGDLDEESVNDEPPTGESADDEELENQYRQQFAETYGFSQDAVQDFSQEQLERWGAELDRQRIQRISGQGQQPQQQIPQFEQDQFQPQQPFVPQPPQQFAPQQPQPGQFAPNDIQRLIQEAEDNGVSEDYINALQSLNQQNAYFQQQQYILEQQRMQQAEQERIERENEFDSALSSLGMPDVFGKDRNSAYQNGVQFETRKKLFLTAQEFSRIEGQPMSEGLVNRVARALFPEQFQKKQKRDLVNKARKQSKRKLGSSISATGKPNSKATVRTGDPETDEILDDPEMAALADKFNMPLTY